MVFSNREKSLKLMWKKNLDLRGNPLFMDVNNDVFPETIALCKNNDIVKINSRGQILKKINLAESKYQKNEKIVEHSKIGIDNSNFFCKILIGTDNKFFVLDHKLNKLSEYIHDSKIKQKPISIENKYILATENNINILNKETLNQKIISKYKLDSEIISPLSVIKVNGESRILYCTDNHKLNCIDENCNKLWEYKTKNIATAKPILSKIKKDGKEHIILPTHGKKIHLININGKKVQDIELKGNSFSKALIDKIYSHEEQIIVGLNSQENNISIINPLIHENNFTKGANVTTTPEIFEVDDNKYLMFGSIDEYLYIIELDQKMELEKKYIKYKLDGKITSQPKFLKILNRNYIFASTNKGNMYQLALL